jgi:hypothetical protein
MEESMSFATKSQNDQKNFQNLDAILGIKEVSDEAAAVCSGGKQYNLGTLKCLDEQDGGFGNDEIYIKVNGKTVWSNNSVSKGESFDLGSLANISGTDRVEVWEKDPGPFNDDLIGSFRPIDDSSPTTLNQNGGKYTLSYKAV